MVSAKGKLFIPPLGNNNKWFAMRIKFLMVCIGLCLIFNLSTINAQQVMFEDNFDQENGGTGKLNYDSLANWTVLSGAIDLIGNGFWDAYPGNGLYLDLDGTLGSDRSQAIAGTIETKGAFSLQPGRYRLSFTLHQNPINKTQINTVLFSVGNVVRSFTKPDPDNPSPSTTETIDFYVVNPTNVRIKFEHLGGDWNGLFLDNMKLVKIQQWDLTGVWYGDFDGKYYLRQLGNTLWWYGETDPNTPGWSNVAKGTISGDHIHLEWADVPKGSVMQSGSLTVKIISNNELQKIEETGGYAGSIWWR